MLALLAQPFVGDRHVTNVEIEVDLDRRLLPELMTERK
jgi:hypothetical protein